MGSSSRHQPQARIRPSDVASETKRNFIPAVRQYYADSYPPFSTLFAQPVEQIRLPVRTPGTLRALRAHPPVFHIEVGDPVWSAICYAATLEAEQPHLLPEDRKPRVPFICAANERRPGGDWETGCAGYEEKLCRRSNLYATLSSPEARSPDRSHYPIPSCGGILSEYVVVYRGPHDSYEKLPQWYDLPVISVPPTRWPKLKDMGSKYSFDEERDMIRDKIRGALTICLAYGWDHVVIGDFGLGNGYRNPPQELAEIWRDVFLLDPDIRGRFSRVYFVFDEPSQSTARLIVDEMARKESKSRGPKSSRSKSMSSSGSNSSSSSSSSQMPAPTDIDIFQYVFQETEIERVLSEPDPRYALQMITT